MADENESIFKILLETGDVGDIETALGLLSRLEEVGLSLTATYSAFGNSLESVSSSLANFKLKQKDIDAEWFKQIGLVDNLGERLDHALGSAAEGFGNVNNLVRDFTANLDESAQHAANMQGIPMPGLFQGLETDQTATETRFGTAVGGPGAITDEGEGGGAGGSGTSLYGAARALRVGGMMTGMPGLSQAGGFLYIEQGLKSVMPLMEQFGQTAATSSPQIASLVAEVTGLGLPMAGLLAVAAPLAIAVGGILIAWTLFENGLKDGEAKLKSALNSQMSYFQAVETMTTKEAEIRTEELRQKVAGDEAAFNETKAAIKRLQDMTGINEELGKTLPGKFGDMFRDLGNQFDINQKAINDDSTELGRFTGGLQSNAFALNDAKAAWEALDKAALKGAEDHKAAVMEYQQDQDMANKGEVDSAKNKSAQLKEQLAANDAAYTDLLAHGDRNSQAVQDQLKKYSDEHNKLAAEIEHLDTVIIPAAQDAKNFADNMKAADDVLKAANQAHDAYTKAIASADTQLAQQEEDAATKEMQQEQALTQGSIQDSYQRSQIALAESRKETTLAQDTANVIADVRTKLGQKEIADLTEYNRKLLDDQTKYQQDVQKDNTGAYRQERDNLQTHIEKLADIHAKEATDQQDALLNRNFLALAKTQQGHQNEIDAENTAYARKQASVQQHLQDELQDLATHQAEARMQQFVEYQRKLVDDRLHAQQEIDQKNLEENRKLQVIRQSEQQQLVDLTTTEQYKLQILRQGFAQEIAMYELQNQRRQQAAAQAESDFWANSYKQNPAATAAAATGQGLADIYNTGSSFVNLLFGNNKNTKDSGGSFGAGEAFSKGNINETFDFGSAGSYMIPGAAMVMPLQSGTATPQGGGGNTFNFTIPISGSGKEEVARQASAAVYKRIMETFTE